MLKQFNVINVGVELSSDELDGIAGGSYVSMSTSSDDGSSILSSSSSGDSSYVSMSSNGDSDSYVTLGNGKGYKTYKLSPKKPKSKKK
ncbi:MAG: hypothetical protein ACRC2R_21720 [Xenococcaceae cyanobacterium]